MSQAAPRNKAAAKKVAAKKTTAARAATAAGAKVPADHKAKAEPTPDFLEANVRGVAWKIPRDAVDDFELLDDINALEQRDDSTRMPSVLRRLLGDQWGQAMDTIRDKESGRVTIEAGTKFVFEILEALNPNSSGS